MPSDPSERKVDFLPGVAAIRDLHLDLRLTDVLSERYSLVVKHKDDPFNTACWCYDNGDKRHIITFGHGIASHVKEGLEDKLPDYAKSYYRHEVAHSLWTCRDLDELNTELKNKGLPFPLFNLIEDARIESRWRSEFGGAFTWLDHEEPLVDPEKLKAGAPPPGATPSPQWAMDVLTTIIQNEGNHSIREEGGVLHNVPEADPIWSFYEKTCAAPDQDMKAIVQLVADWASTFGIPPNIPNGSSRAGAGDAQVGAEAASDPGKVEQSANEKEGEDAHASIGTTCTPTSFTTGQVLSRIPVRSLDRKRADRLAHVLEAAFRFGDIREKSEQPSRRLSIRDVIMSRPEIFVHKKKANAVSARLYVLFDNSGSMGGAPTDAAAHLALALGNLARKGRLEGFMGFTKINSSAAAVVQNLPLNQIDDKVCARIQSDGMGEGITPALRRSLPLITGSDLVLCFTDGNITDAPVPPDLRETLHKKGVWTVGMYVGDATRAPDLKNHFDYAVSRGSEVNLAVALATMIRRYSLTHSRIYGEDVKAGAAHRVEEPMSIDSVSP